MGNGGRVEVLPVSNPQNVYKYLGCQAIYAEGIKNVTAGANPMDLKRGIDQAVEAVVKQLKSFFTGRRSARTA